VTSPNTNIDELLENKPYRACKRCGNEWFCDLGMVEISIKEAEEANEKYLKTQLEALLSAAKIEGEIKGLNWIKSQPSTYNFPTVDKRIKFLEKELEKK
jgi:hypothetical protein